MTSERYYDWRKTLSFNAPITMVITARGYGKTYGIRRQVVLDWLRRSQRFVAITRYSKRLPKIMAGYFSQVGVEFPDIALKCEGDGAFISKDGKKWEHFGYFVAMTEKQGLKEQTFMNVRRIIFDECLIERDDEFHDYLDDEWGKLSSIVNTVARERADSKTKPQLYLIGNACGMINPFFQVIGVSREPRRGYSWWLDGLVLLDYHDDPIYSRETRQTLAGRMETAQNGDIESMALDNRFLTADKEMLGKKTSNATHLFTLTYRAKPLSVWVDTSVGLYFVTSKTPKRDAQIYALTTDDKPNYQLLSRSNLLLKTVWEAYKLRAVRFENTVLWQTMLDLLRFCGYK